MLSRMKYIHRWGLMRNTKSENLSEHSLETAFIAYALAVIRNRRLGGNVDADRAAVLAMFHDAPEIITGDLPTPVKYDNPGIRDAYRRIEEAAEDRLLSLLPGDLREDFTPLFRRGDTELAAIVRAADKLSALIKCIEEKKMGNTEFTAAEAAVRKKIEEMNLPEAAVFMEEFLPSFRLTLDEQN